MKREYTTVLRSVLIITILSILPAGFGCSKAQAGAPALMWEDLEQLDYRTGEAPDSLKSLADKQVRIPGFMVPLEDSQTHVREFLLVPYRGACVHVPPPPPNQIVHVRMAGAGIEVNWMDPIWVYGTLRIERTKNVYAEASFGLEGRSTEIYVTEEDM